MYERRSPNTTPPPASGPSPRAWASVRLISVAPRQRSVRAARDRTSTTPPWVRPQRAPNVPGMTSSPSSKGVGMNEARPPKW
jgi:hypothetical protein